MNIPIVSTLAKAWRGNNPRVRTFFALALAFALGCGGTLLLWNAGSLGAGAAGTAAFLLGAMAAACVAAICTFQAMVERKQAGDTLAAAEQ
ncbi:MULTISPECIES: hypothetical protein [unclassified Massilia]|uniref:hypothetical protein n=1 Tax=unclassified Massilia TaxID=2609279 RepID=UPI00177FA3CC|nr:MULTISPECIES: hypothetical protein [unclassified Massilia]MBD8529970.1 hypothetical protein [Massilia sp. CFBP 13647]MBD8673888.1 hypothetical protein [Massilia sp. CFBP 13721]